MLTNKDIFESAFAAYIPSADDAVENIPFYRAWFGMKAVLEKYGYADPYKAPINVHTLCGWATKDGQWSEILRAMPMVEPKSPEKDRRYHSMFYASEPALPTEKDARAVFESSYRAQFPGKRINSKDAKEKWEKCKGKALGFATENYNDLKVAYDKKVADHEAREAKEEAEWQGKLAAHAETVALIEKLKTE